VIVTAGITMQFGEKPLFENVSVKFGGGNRYGLIGANGCGKSTFMKILGRKLEPTAGSISIPSDLRVGVLGQDQFAFEEFSVLDTVMMGHKELWEIREQRDALYSKPEMSDEDGILAGELEARFAELDGYTAESRAGELLMGVGIPVEQHAGPMSAIAPGVKLRVLLSQVLFADPDFLLLDEPTNNLDINTIRWLETILISRKSTMIIISHDRHFLNTVCTHMADLDYGAIRLYPGNYDEYMTAATQTREQLVADNARKKAKIAELQEFVSRFSANASKAKQATSRARQIDKIKLEDIPPSSRKSPYIRFDVDKKLHHMVAEISDIAQYYDPHTPLLQSLNALIEVGERIAIIGANGVGKTTLLRTLVGELPPKAGQVKWTENAQVGYFAQDHAHEFEEDRSLYNWVDNWSRPEDDEQVIRGTLGRLLFSRDEINKSVTVLSGGEKGRILFGKLMLIRPNVLVMDEPTNHLDMESIESLNLALENYTGTLIFVSHDRQFVSSLATRIIEITPEGIVDYRGTYDEYLHSQGIEAEQKIA